MEFTSDLVFTRDLETRAVIVTRVVGHAYQLYYFVEFSHDDGNDSSAVSSADFDHTSSVDSNFEEDFGYLNLGILTYDQVLEPSISSPPIDIPSTILPNDIFIHIAMDSSDSVQQDIHCLPVLVPWDDYLIDISILLWSPTLHIFETLLMTFIFSLVKMILL